MELHKLGLTFNLAGAIFLGLHIMGKERLKKIEEFIISIPKTLPDKILGIIIGKALEHRIKNSLYVQKILKKVTDKLSQKNTKPETVSRNNKEIARVLAPCIILGFLLTFMIWIAISPIVAFMYLVVKPLHCLQKNLKLESFLGLVGIMFLIAGFILQILW